VKSEVLATTSSRAGH